MVRKVGGRESQEAAKGWGDALRTAGHVSCPKFQVATIGVLPIVVQEQKDVDPAVQLKARVPVEVCGCQVYRGCRSYVCPSLDNADRG